ncbi:MAG TPA: hypothetical protein VMN57_15225 [Anaerolineales bacterium]|nr:hypothetical protein [Anaerolineales bacterium]
MIPHLLLHLHSRRFHNAANAIALAVLAASLLAACSTGPSTAIPLPTAKVPSLFEVNSAIDHWETSGNDNYFVAVEETSAAGTFLYRVVIMDGEIQAAQRLELVDGAWQQPVALDRDTAEQYTVDALHERILNDIQGEGAAPLNMLVVYDDVDGHPTLVDATAIQSYNEAGQIRLNREHSYVLTIAVDVLLEDSFGANKNPILTLTRSGGESAACSTLRIYDDGTSLYADNCRQILLQLRPPEDSFTRLQDLVADFANIIETRMVDGQAQEFILHGTGDVDPGPEASAEIWDLALSLDELLSRPIGEGITLLVRGGDAMFGVDMRSSLSQPATIDLSPPLHGGLVNGSGDLLVYSDAAGLKWLETVSGDAGTYFSNTAATWVVPVAMTGDERVVLNRYSSGSDQVEWGWVSLEERSWQPLPVLGSCITDVGASPVDGRLAVATGSGDGCESEAAVWVIDLAAGEAVPIAEEMGGAEHIAWSPDGAWLAYAAPGGSVGQVYILRPDGTERTALTGHISGLVSGLVWRPGGETLVYGLQGAGEADGLYEMDPENGEAVLSLLGENLAPIGFDPSGEFLAVAEGADLVIWVLSFGQVQPAAPGGAENGFVGFIGGATEE